MVNTLIMSKNSFDDRTVLWFDNNSNYIGVRFYTKINPILISIAFSYRYTVNAVL